MTLFYLFIYLFIYLFMSLKATEPLQREGLTFTNKSPEVSSWSSFEWLRKDE